MKKSPVKQPRMPRSEGKTPLFLGRRLSAALAITTIALASCGGSSTGNKQTGGTTGLNPAGILRVGAALTAGPAGPITFDPTKALAQATNAAWQIAVYDTLFHRNPTNGSYTPGLATNAAVVNPTTLTITLRPHVAFSDGTSFDANAVKFSLLRNKTAPQHGQFNPSLERIVSIDVTNSLNLTIHFGTPVAGLFFTQLSLPSTFIVSPTAAQKPGANIGTAPVGAGPYKVTSFVPNQSIALVKNPTYWDAGAIRLGALEFINVAAGPTEVDALEAGTVDVQLLSNFSNIPVLQSSHFTVDELTATNPYNNFMCKSQAPFNDVRVRQALNYAVDRPLIISSVFHGAAEPLWGIWASSTPYYDSSLANFYSYNPAKAKQLLAEAGYPNGFKTSGVLFAGTALAQVAQVLQQEWAAVGVHISIDQSQNPTVDYFVRHVAPLNVGSGAAAGDYGPANQYIPGNLGDVCNYSDPGITAEYGKLAALDPRSAQAISAARQLQDNAYKNALMVYIVNANFPVAYNSKVRNLVANPFYTNYFVLDYWSGIGVT